MASKPPKSHLQNFGSKKALTPADLEKIADLMLKGVLTEGDAEVITKGKPVKRVAEKARGPRVKVEVDGPSIHAMEKGEVVGDLQFSIVDKKFLVSEIFVQPENRGSGYGYALMRKAESIAKKNGCAAMLLEVDVDNHRARQFFEEYGFSDVHAYQSRKLNRVMMRKELK